MLDLSQIQTFFPEEVRPFRSNMLREYLQYKILESVFRSPHGAGLAFMGGTCIHIVHGSPRFSEDLDFDNTALSAEDFEALAGTVRGDLELEGYSVELKTSLAGAFRAFFRFPALLFESGLTGHKEQKLLIQLDTEPQRFEYEPYGAIVNKFDVFSRIRTVPADILLAQKFTCIFRRPRPMGRDFYDAVFLMSKTQPNMAYLAQKLRIKNRADLKRRLLTRCKELDLKKLAGDIEPFITKPGDKDRVLMFREYMEPLAGVPAGSRSGS